MKQIAIGKHPYTFARVSAMKANLLGKEEYARLVKMSLNEVISFIQEGQYKKEVDELAVQYKGVDLLEQALNKNLKQTVEKILNISKRELQYVIQAYLMRNDIKNIKTIVRSKFTQLPDEEVDHYLLPSGVVSEARLNEMRQAENVSDAIRSCIFLDKTQVKDAVKEFEETGLLLGFETMLDKIYFARLADFSQRIPKQGKLIREFLSKEIDIVNTMTLLRLKRAGASEQEMKKHVIDTPHAKQIFAAATAEDLSGFERLFTSWKMKDEIKLGLEKAKEGSLVQIETDLQKHLLKDAIVLIRRNPLSVDVILGYLFAKEIEIRNLKTILKSKQLGLEDSYAEQQLVTVNA